jgi:hypothetical protein
LILKEGNLLRSGDIVGYKSLAVYYAKKFSLPKEEFKALSADLSENPKQKFD